MNREAALQGMPFAAHQPPATAAAAPPDSAFAFFQQATALAYQQQLQKGGGGGPAAAAPTGLQPQQQQQHLCHQGWPQPHSGDPPHTADAAGAHSWRVSSDEHLIKCVVAAREGQPGARAAIRDFVGASARNRTAVTRVMLRIGLPPRLAFEWCVGR